VRKGTGIQKSTEGMEGGKEIKEGIIEKNGERDRKADFYVRFRNVDYKLYATDKTDTVKKAPIQTKKIGGRRGGLNEEGYMDGGREGISQDLTNLTRNQKRIKSHQLPGMGCKRPLKRRARG